MLFPRLVIFNIIVLAMPSTQMLLPHSFNFWTGEPLTPYNAFSCSESQKNLINLIIEDAAALAEAGKDIKINDPAYKAFIDRKANDITPTSEQRLTHEAVAKRLKTAYHYLTKKPKTAQPKTAQPKTAQPETAQPETAQPETAFIRIVCGKVWDRVEGCKEKQEAGTLNDGYDGLPTIIICPLLLEKAETSIRLKDLVSREEKKGLMVDICSNPESLGLADLAGRVFLHEVMHLHKVVPMKTNRVWTEAIDCVYGAYLSGYVAEHSSQVALANADNYAWMAISKWLNDNCESSQAHKMFYQKEQISGKNLPENQPMGGKWGYKRCKLPGDAGSAIKLNDPTGGKDEDSDIGSGEEFSEPEF